MKITFTTTNDVISEKYYPKPASKFMPKWYEESKSYLNNEKVPTGGDSTTATIKRCMPILDSIISGYMITSMVDVWVKQVDVQENDINIKQPYYEWPSLNPIGFHPIGQAPNYPNNTGHVFSYPKWMNPWSIKTPPGYSTLFIQPLHRKSDFTILPGVVDTDKYTAPINFPFVLNDINFEGLIPAGTPIVQVIPFKRESWELEIGNKKDFENQNKASALLKSKFFDSYKTNFRQLKEYK
jgi:hypothetical protein